jgi:hypothetical protein
MEKLLNEYLLTTCFEKRIFNKKIAISAITLINFKFVLLNYNMTNISSTRVS